MNSILEFLKENGQLTLAGLGALILIGAIFNINFITDRRGQPASGFLSLVGDKGYRIILGMIGMMMIAYGVFLLI